MKHRWHYIAVRSLITALFFSRAKFDKLRGVHLWRWSIIGLMSREEVLEERKLSVVKSWFSRSVSSGALHGPIHDSISDGNNSDGALASRQGMEDRDSWAGLTTLRQLSMRYIFDHRFLIRFYPISYSIQTPQKWMPSTL